MEAWLRYENENRPHGAVGNARIKEGTIQLPPRQDKGGAS